MAEHAFASAATRLNLLDLVTAGTGCCDSTGAVCPPCRRTHRDSPVAEPSLYVVPGLVRARVDSPRETMLRLCLVLAGLPAPDCNLVMGSHDHPIGRVDLVFKEFGVLIEYEGDQHRIDRWQWNVDIGRYEEFTAGGYLVIRVTSAAMRREREVVCRVDAALRSRGYCGPASTSQPSGAPSSSLCFDHSSPSVRKESPKLVCCHLGDDQRTRDDAGEREGRGSVN